MSDGQRPEEQPVAVTGVGPRRDQSSAGAAVPVPPLGHLPPAPLPVGAMPPRDNRAKIAVVAVAGVFVLLIAWGIAVLFVAAVSKVAASNRAVSSTSSDASTDPSGNVITDATTPGDVIASAMWVGGRYVVAQQWDGSSQQPVVSVWDSKTGAVRRAPGHRLVAVEPGSTRLWLAPDDGKALVKALDAAKQHFDEVGGQVAVVAEDGADAPSTALVSWDVSGTGVHLAAASRYEWRRWSGPGAWGVEMALDQGTGAYPTSLTFTRSDGSGSKVVANLPTLHGVRTWEPVAWSPSGRYLLVRPLPRPTVTQTPALVRLAPKVLDAETGEVVSWAAKVMPDPSAYVEAAVVWDDQTDALYGVTQSPDTNIFGLRMVRPDGAVTDVPVLREDSTSVFGSFDPYFALSADDPGTPLFSIADRDEVDGVYSQRTWLLHAGESRRVGRFEEVGSEARYSPEAGLFVASSWSGDYAYGYDVLRLDGTPVAHISEP